MFIEVVHTSVNTWMVIQNPGKVTEAVVLATFEGNNPTIRRAVAATAVIYAEPHDAEINVFASAGLGLSMRTFIQNAQEKLT